MERLTKDLLQAADSLKKEPALLYHAGRYAVVRRLDEEGVRNAFAAPARWHMLQVCRPSMSLEMKSPDAYLARMQFFRSLGQDYEMEATVSRQCADGTEEPLGYIVASAYDPINQKVELAAAFYRGQGTRAALEAMAWVVNTCFDSLKLHKLIFYVIPTQTASLRLLQRLGLTPEACLRDELRLPDGQRTDLLRFALFLPQWTLAKSRMTALHGLDIAYHPKT